MMFIEYLYLLTTSLTFEPLLLYKSFPCLYTLTYSHNFDVYIIHVPTFKNANILCNIIIQNISFKQTTMYNIFGECNCVFFLFVCCCCCCPCYVSRFLIVLLVAINVGMSCKLKNGCQYECRERGREERMEVHVHNRLNSCNVL